MNAKEWINAFAEQVGAEPPTTEEFNDILDLAGIAAHSSERVAAPVACWLSARAGLSLEDSLKIAGGIGGD